MLKIVVATSLAALVTGFSTVPKTPMGDEMIDEDEIEDPWNGWGGMPELDPEEIAAWNKTAEEIEAKWAELVEDAPYQEVATAEEWAKGTTDEKKRWAGMRNGYFAGINPVMFASEKKMLGSRAVNESTTTYEALVTVALDRLSQDHLYVLLKVEMHRLDCLWH